MRALDARDALPPSTPRVPDLHALIRRTRREDGRFRGAPLKVFDARGVRGERLREGVEPRRRRRRQVDLRVDVAREQAQRRRVRFARGRPVHREALGTTMGVDRECRILRSRLVHSVTRDIQSLDERPDVPYVYFASLRPRCDIVRLRDGWERCIQG